MALERDFAHALVPPSICVLGSTLECLSLWHLEVLRALGSPFVNNSFDAEVTIGDLHLAVAVCLHKPRSTLRLKPRARDVLIRWLYSRHFEREARAFMAWLLAHQVTPEMWDGPSEVESRPISAPPLLYRVSQLVAMGIPHSEAWAMSPGYATWLLAAHDERTTPGVRFWTQEDERIAAEIKEQPDLTDAEQVETARRELPPHLFEQWMESRRANPDIETPPHRQSRFRSLKR